MSKQLPIPADLLILKVFHAQKNHIRPLLNQRGITPGQPKILHYLSRHASALQREIAHACDIDSATISQLLDNMEANALIVRRTDSADRRVARISLTAAGTACQKELAEYFDAYNRKLLQGFDAEERQQLDSFLRRLYHNLTEHEIDF